MGRLALLDLVAGIQSSMVGIPTESIRAEFLAAYFKPLHVWKIVTEGSKGLGDRRQRVQPAQILSHELLLPPIEWQNRIAEIRAEVDEMKRLQAETAAELDALLHSIRPPSLRAGGVASDKACNPKGFASQRRIVIGWRMKPKKNPSGATLAARPVRGLKHMSD